MTRTRTAMVATALAMCLGFLAQNADAWGPRAQRALTRTSLQLLRRHYPEAFRTQGLNYEKDLYYGSHLGADAYGNQAVLTTPKHVVQFVDKEIQLLRQARKYGAGSFFAFRMGALGAVASDLLLPYSFSQDAEARRLSKFVAADIDQHIQDYQLQSSAAELECIRDPYEYFAKKRVFVVEAEHLISVDYERGDGYDGYLRNGAEVFFTDGVLAVTDLWHTILRQEGDANDARPSDEALTWYFADEIGYQLNVKESVAEANKAYARFARVNPGILAAYEHVGTLYYQAGERERGVQEWKIALTFSGPERQRVIKRISNHYMDVGQNLLAAAFRPNPPPRALDDALAAFTQVLEIDMANDDAAKLLGKTAKELTLKEERLQLAVGIIATAEKLMAQASQSQEGGAYADAINLYKQALGLYGTVDEEFEAPHQTAQTNSTNASAQIDAIINQVLSKAEGVVDEADSLVSQDRFDEAIKRLQTVPSIIDFIPDEEYGARKQELAALAGQKTQEAKNAQLQWQEEQKRRKEAAERRAKAAQDGKK